MFHGGSVTARGGLAQKAFLIRSRLATAALAEFGTMPSLAAAGVFSSNPSNNINKVLIDGSSTS
jgi:hypothetical protein